MLIAQALQLPPANIVANWPTIQGSLMELGMDSELIDIAALGTIRIECPKFTPMAEEYNGDPHIYFKKYDNDENLGNLYPGDGYLYRGRGYIQISGRYNYTLYSKETGFDLISNPDLALQPIPAAKIFARFFKNRDIGVYACMENWRKVRLLVNGGLNGYSDFLAYINRLLEATV